MCKINREQRKLNMEVIEVLPLLHFLTYKKEAFVLIKPPLSKVTKILHVR